MTPEYVLRKSLCRPAFCGRHVPDNATDEQRDQAKQSDIRSAISEIENMDYSAEYAEPGYSQPERGILFANWNYFPRNLPDLLEKMGYQIEWSDEWTTCQECGRALRASPDCYSWQPSYFLMNECEIYCKDCADISEYLREKENDPNTALNDHIDPADYGYVQLKGDFENGWHPGQNDDPKKIFEQFSGQYSRLLFVVDSVGQFDLRFSLWYYPTDEENEEE